MCHPRRQRACLGVRRQHVPTHELGHSASSVDGSAGARCAAAMRSSQDSSSHAQNGNAPLAELRGLQAIAATSSVVTVVLDGTAQLDPRGPSAPAAPSRLPPRARGVRPGATGAVRGAGCGRSRVGACSAGAALVDRRAPITPTEAVGRIARPNGRRLPADLEPYGSGRALDGRNLDGRSCVRRLHRAHCHGSRALDAAKTHLSVPSARAAPERLELRPRRRCGYHSVGRGDERSPSPGDLSGHEVP